MTLPLTEPKSGVPRTIDVFRGPVHLRTTDYFDGPVKRPGLRGRRNDYDWEFWRIPLTRRLTATQGTLSEAVVDLYVLNPYARTPYSPLQDLYPILLDDGGRLMIYDGHHRITAAMRRGDSHIDCWVGTRRDAGKTALKALEAP